MLAELRTAREHAVGDFATQEIPVQRLAGPAKDRVDHHQVVGESMRYQAWSTGDILLALM